MQVNVSNNIWIEDPTPAILDYCKSELVVNNPVYAQKKRMGLSTYRIPTTLRLYEQKGTNQIILPFGALADVFRLANGDICPVFPAPHNIDYNCTVPLYDYQQDAVEAMQDADFGILKAPAGSGKTQMGIALIAAYGKRALWLTHTHDLLMQSYNRAALYMDKSLLGTITEGKVNISEGITFATVQTMARMDLTGKQGLWDVVVVDECHRVAGSPTQVTQFARVLGQLQARHKFGLSATVHRADGMIKATYAMIGKVAYEVPDDAVLEKVMPVGITPVVTDYQIDMDCLNPDGTMNYSAMLTDMGRNDERNLLILQYLMAEKGHSCLVLSERIEHLQNLYHMLPAEMQCKAAVITGLQTSKALVNHRDHAIEAMRTGEHEILFASYRLAKEGLDIPRLDRLFMTMPQKDYAVVVQSVGRVARRFEGKEDAVVYDFIDEPLRRYYRDRLKHYHKIKCYFTESGKEI